MMDICSFFQSLSPSAVHLRLRIDTGACDPLGVREQVALKMLLNAHSTAVMTRLGRVVGNTMTSVRPSNLKLIGRATYLIQLHVNAVIEQLADKKRPPATYAEANAVLFEAIAWKKRCPSQRHSEVELAIVRMLETVLAADEGDKGGHIAPIPWQNAFDKLHTETLEQYLYSVVERAK